MSNIFKAQIVILCLCLAFVACRKADSILPNQDKPANTNLLQRNGDSTDYQKVTTFLQNKKSSLRTYEANKIDTLLSHLSGQNVMVFEMDDSLDVIICDLSTYRNESIPGYSNTFYKAYFPMNNGTVTDGLIYTIHTNSSKTQVDSDLENIFKQKSRSFTGQTVVNTLNDQFLQALDFDGGQLEASYNATRSLSSTGPTCYAYYLETTYYYTDGSVETESELLFTLCSSCGEMGPIGQPKFLMSDNDCGGSSGGGGSPTPPADEVENLNVSSSVEETEVVTSSQYINVRHPYTRHKRRGYTWMVTASPAWISNPIVPYLHANGKECIRYAQLGGHSPSVIPMGTSWYVSWGYQVYTKYVFSDGTPTKTGAFWNTQTITVK